MFFFFFLNFKYRVEDYFENVAQYFSVCRLNVPKGMAAWFPPLALLPSGCVVAGAREEGMSDIVCKLHQITLSCVCGPIVTISHLYIKMKYKAAYI